MLTIRRATLDDVPQLLALIRELATYEKKRHKAVVTEEDLLRDGFGSQPKFRMLVAQPQHGEAAGYTSFFYFYSTFQGRSALFLEDLFVLEKFRGKGIGKALRS